MPRYSRSIAAPRYRHIFPVAPELTFEVASALTPAPTSALMDYVSSGETQKVLPPFQQLEHRVTASLWVTLDGIPLPNIYNIIGYIAGKPVWGYSAFEYVRATNTLTFYTAIAEGVAVEIHERVVEYDGFALLEVPRYVLLQGARNFPEPRMPSGTPTPEKMHLPISGVENKVEYLIRLPMDGPDGRFLGGFQCVLEILSPCVKGQVRMSASQTGFEYHPLVGYSGKDSFSYRVLTPFGQQSDASCIQLLVG